MGDFQAIFEVQVLMALEQAASPHRLKLRVPRCIAYKEPGKAFDGLRGMWRLCGRAGRKVRRPGPVSGERLFWWLEGADCDDAGARTVSGLFFEAAVPKSYLIISPGNEKT